MAPSPDGKPFSSQLLLERLQTLTVGLEPARWLVAYSGGVDSTALLHALVHAGTARPVVAIHVDHGLHPGSAAWGRHCEAEASSLGVDFIGRRVVVADSTDSGPEAAARHARYSAFLAIVQTGDCLLSAHHETDQAETLLLNLLRGSGPAGLAGIGVRQPFGRGHLLRPLIGVDGSALEAYARDHGLAWIDDPSNEDTRFDRNFLRREILPRLAGRWPAVSQRLARSAELMSEASELLNDLAAIDLGGAEDPGAVVLASLRGLPEARLRNAIRHAVKRCGLPPPPATALNRITDELIPARPDARPLVAWAGGEARRYRGILYLRAPQAERRPPPGTRLYPGGPAVPLGEGMGQVSLATADGPGIDPDIAAAGLEIRFRAGGEALQTEAGGPTRKLKKLLQDAGVLPWMREALPLFYHDDRLVAVADLWLDAGAVRDPGLWINWSGKPAIRATISL